MKTAQEECELVGRADYKILGVRASFQGWRPAGEVAWFMLVDGSVVQVLASQLQTWWDTGRIIRWELDT